MYFPRVHPALLHFSALFRWADADQSLLGRGRRRRDGARRCAGRWPDDGGAVMGATIECVSVNGVELEFESAGSGDAVVFIHGGGVADSSLPLAVGQLCGTTTR
jgi:hypothetical protein